MDEGINRLNRPEFEFVKSKVGEAIKAFPERFTQYEICVLMRQYADLCQSANMDRIRELEAELYQLKSAI